MMYIPIARCTINPGHHAFVSMKIFPAKGSLKNKKSRSTNHNRFLHPRQVKVGEATNHKLIPAFKRKVFFYKRYTSVSGEGVCLPATVTCVDADWLTVSVTCMPHIRWLANSLSHVYASHTRGLLCAIKLHLYRIQYSFCNLSRCLLWSICRKSGTVCVPYVYTSQQTS